MAVVITGQLAATCTGEFKTEEPMGLKIPDEHKAEAGTIVHDLAVTVSHDGKRTTRHIALFSPDIPEEDACSEATWERMETFLTGLASAAAGECYAELPAPGISLADSQSIDLFWNEDGRTLLINIPADTSEHLEYYGSRVSGDTIGGTISGKMSRSDLARWLCQTLS